MLRGPTLGGPYTLGGAKLIDRGGMLEGLGANPTRTVRGARLGGLESRAGGTSTMRLGSDFGVKLDGGGLLVKATSSGSETAATTRPVLKMVVSPSSCV